MIRPDFVGYKHASAVGLLSHRFFALILVLIPAALLVGAGQRALAPGSGRIVVAIKSDLALDIAAAGVGDAGFRVEQTLDDLHAVEVTARGRATADAVQVLSTIPGVRYAEPVTGMAVADYPGDPCTTTSPATCRS